MEDKMRLWFRNGKRLKGMMAIGSATPNTCIMLGKQEVGFIAYNDMAECLRLEEGIRIYFRFKDGDYWRNAKMKYIAADRADAERWVRDNWDAIEPRIWK
jgi:hypothetical protein